VTLVAPLIHNSFPSQQPILEPCCGRGAIASPLKLLGYQVHCNDLYADSLASAGPQLRNSRNKNQIQLTPLPRRTPISSTKNTDFRTPTAHDYLTYPTGSLQRIKSVITNPPFSLWDEFVAKAREHCTRWMFIGRLNYFGTQSRLDNNLWAGLKSIHIFSRYVDYRTPFRTDGHFHVGAMATAWFLWDLTLGNVHAPTLHFVDVSQYATLGNVPGKPLPLPSP
jgi:predicted RNA methylase